MWKTKEDDKNEMQYKHQVMQFVFEKQKNEHS